MLVVGSGCDGRNHHFVTVSREPIETECGNHSHIVTFHTDTYEGYFHGFSGCTGEELEICDGHMHYLDGLTTEQYGYRHHFKVITHIEDPTEDSFPVRYKKGALQQLRRSFAPKKLHGFLLVHLL